MRTEQDKLNLLDAFHNILGMSRASYQDCPKVIRLREGLLAIIENRSLTPDQAFAAFENATDGLVV